MQISSRVWESAAVLWACDAYVSPDNSRQAKEAVTLLPHLGAPPELQCSDCALEAVYCEEQNALPLTLKFKQQ